MDFKGCREYSFGLNSDGCRHISESASTPKTNFPHGGPCFATRWTIAELHFGQDGATTAGAGRGAGCATPLPVRIAAMSRVPSTTEMFRPSQRTLASAVKSPEVTMYPPVAPRDARVPEHQEAVTPRKLP